MATTTSGSDSDPTATQTTGLMAAIAQLRADLNDAVRQLRADFAEARKEFVGVATYDTAMHDVKNRITELKLRQDAAPTRDKLDAMADDVRDLKARLDASPAEGRAKMSLYLTMAGCAANVVVGMGAIAATVVIAVLTRK